MGPLLSAVASIGKGFLSKKASGLLNGKDKNEISDTQNEVPYDTSNDTPVEMSNEYHSANDDNPAMNTTEAEGNLETDAIPEDVPEVTPQEETITENTIPEANNTESEFSVDNVIIPGEQEATEIQATTDNADITNTDDIANVLDSTSSIQPSSISLSGTGSTMPVASTMQSTPSIDAIENTETPNVDQNDTLVEAIENKDPVAVENAIESDPVEAESILKDDTALDNEAVQATDGGNDAEVNNEVVKEALKQDPEELIGTRPNFHENDPAIERMQARIDRLNNRYKPEDADEDFLGPDEYIDENGNIQVDPNWKPEDADEDFVGPDEQLAVINQTEDEDFVEPDKQLAIYNGGAPEEVYLDPIYDTSDYNFDWDYDIETLGVASPEEIPDAPVKNKEQAKAKQRLMNWFKSKHLDQSSKSGPVDSTPSDNRNERLSMAGRKAGALSIPASGSGSVSSASMGNGTESQPESHTSSSIASKAPLPVALEDNQGREVSVNGKVTTMPVSGKNGSMRSGSFGLMSKPGKNTKVGKPVGATSKGSYHTQSNGSMKSKQVATDGKEIIIERIKTLLSKLPPETASEIGFKGDTYKGKSLESYDGNTLQSISKQLENLIGE